MNQQSTHQICYSIVGSLSGMILGFTVFLITEKIIFLIAFTTIGLTLGISRGQVKQKNSTQNKE